MEPGVGSSTSREYDCNHRAMAETHFYHQICLSSMYYATGIMKPLLIRLLPSYTTKRCKGQRGKGDNNQAKLSLFNMKASPEPL